MYKIILIVFVGIFLSSGALVYQNGNLSLNIDNAKNSLVNAFNSVTKLAEGHQ